jgi:hypoxanthine phosphoribosyltransferase
MTSLPEVVFGAEQIRRRVEEVGAEIARAYAGREVCVVGLMKSCLVFMADLIRAVPGDLTCHMLRVQTFRDSETGSPRHDIVYYADIPYEGKDVLLLDDILDTGITLDFILEHVRARRPRSLRTCVLVDKPTDRKVGVRPDWALFTLEEPDQRFLVGYGLDWGEHHRGLPYIGAVPRPLDRAGSGAAAPGGPGAGQGAGPGGLGS